MGLFSSSQTTTSGPTGPALDLYNTLKNYYGQAMTNTPNFMQGYEQGGLNSIQKGVAANEQGVMNANASHGVRGAAAAYASTVPTVAGQSQVANLETSLPMVRSQYQQAVMDRSAQGIQLGPHEQTTTTNPSTFGSLATILAGMYGMKQMKGMSGMPNASGTGSYDSSNPLAGGLPNGMENYIPDFGGGN